MPELKRVLFLILITLAGCNKSLVESPQVSPVTLIPRPQQLSIDSGYFLVTPKTVISVESDSLSHIAWHFTKSFSEACGWAPEIKANDASGQIVLKFQRDIPVEGYRLQVRPGEVQLSAGSGSGFFYGLQTLIQLLPAEFVSDQAHTRKQWAIPAVTIEDAPSFGWRGFMLDVSRHFFDKARVMQLVDMIAELKMNRLHLHLTDDQGWRMEIKKYPRLTEIGAWRVDHTNYDESISDWWGRPAQQPGDQATYGGFYSQSDIKEIISYARERFIEIIPEIDMPGHAQATIAAYPEIGCVNAAPYVATGGVFRNNTYNPGKEETFEFIENTLNEVMGLFPFDYIHIGGDECNKEQWKMDPHAQKRMRDLGLENEEELQSYFIKRVEGIINKRGRKLIGWDEILEGGLAPNATVMSWRGEAGGITAAQAGHDVIMTPSEYCYIDLKQGPDDLEPNLGYSHMFLKDAYLYRLIPQDLSEEKAGHILGTQANLWTESISDWGKLTYMTYPRIYAIAENGWTNEELQHWDDFIYRLEPQLKKLEYQDIRFATSAFNVKVLHKGLENGIEFKFQTEVNDLDYYYTLDGSEPDTLSARYTGPFTLSQGVDLKARAFKKGGEPVGVTSSLTFPIHLASSAKVRYISPYLEYKDAAGPRALVDYNYASLTVADDNWQGFEGDMEVILDFPAVQKVSEVRLTNLRFTISGVYVPESHEVYGSIDGVNYQLLGKTDMTVESHTQGRNKVLSVINFQPVEVSSLKIISNSLNPIPKAHHRAGEPSKVYLDEIVVF